MPVPGCPGLLVDIERGAIRLARCKALAVQLGVEYWHIDDLACGR